MKEHRYYSAEEGHGCLYELAATYLKGGERVLDLCCGAGYGCEILLRKASVYLGVDYDLECIAWAREHHPLGLFACVDLCEDPLPLLGQVIDFFTWIEGIEHLARIDLVLREISRVAKPGAPLLLSTPSRSWRNPQHKHEYSLKELLNLFPRAINLGIHGRFESQVILWRVQP